MRLRALMIGLIGLIGLAAGRPVAASNLMYAIGDGGASLVRFSSDSPGSAERVGFFGGADSFLDAIDFRPATGELFGYRHVTNSYFVVDVNTGALRLASAPDAGATTNTFFLGIDWNPTIDRMRVVTDSTQNLVFNPDTGTAITTTPLFYAQGDPNAAFIPLVIANAYTNNLPIPVATSQQFVLDYGLNVLATLANNEGTLRTVGEVRIGSMVVDFDELTGFDIFTDFGGNDTAFALLTVGGAPGLYTIDLATGAATSLGAIGSGLGIVYSLAVVPIPEPSSLAMVGLGAAGLAIGAALRRRRPGEVRTGQ